MGDNGPFITLPTTAEFTRSASRRSRRSTLTKLHDLQNNMNKATYYDAVIAATREGKSEADAIIHAEGVVQAIQDELKLNRITTSLNCKEEAIDKSGVAGQFDLINEEPNDSGSDSDVEFDEEGNPLRIVGQKSAIAFEKLKRAMVKISTFTASKTEKSSEPIEILNISELHKKLDVTVHQYDTIMDRVLEDTEYQMEKLIYDKLLEAEDRFKAKLRLQYETLRSHVKCDTQIDNLRKENAILKQEMKEMIMSNSQIASELKDLRIYKSNAEAEERLMSEKLANRKTHIRVLTNKVKKLQESLALRNSDTQEDHTCHESYPSENERTEHEQEPQEMENIDTEEPVEEITRCYLNAESKRPKWNTSRKTNLLNKDIFSIMHNIEYQDDDFANDTSRMTEEDIHHKIDKKYRTQISGLKFQLESERKEARKVSALNMKRNHKMKKIIEVLKDCLLVLHNDQKDNDSTVISSDTKSLSSTRSRRQEVEAIYERKELLTNLINGLNGGQSVEFDYYSTTDKEDSQIYRESRPSSTGIHSSKDVKLNAPIVPIQLKSEKNFKMKKKSNEFHSVKGWVIAARNRTAPANPGIMTVSLIESAIKTEHDKNNNEEILKTTRKPEVESIMRRQRPVSAKTNTSQNSVRFAPTLEECSSDATFKRSRRAVTPLI